MKENFIRLVLNLAIQGAQFASSSIKPDLLHSHYQRPDLRPAHPIPHHNKILPHVTQPFKCTDAPQVHSSSQFTAFRRSRCCPDTCYQSVLQESITTWVIIALSFHLTSPTTSEFHLPYTLPNRITLNSAFPVVYFAQTQSVCLTTCTFE